MKKIILLSTICCLGLLHVFGQQRLSGTVVNTDRTPLTGTTIRLKNSNTIFKTDQDGRFSMPKPASADSIVVTHVGYQDLHEAILPTTGPSIILVLQPADNALKEVVINTGYYQVPQERATGSFTHIDNELLNRSVGSNILERLEGVTNGLQFTRNNLTGENVNAAPDLRIRGLSTINGDTRPLIVVDNFPYEGDINTLNPNDISSVTILRDAAAASIWGARAGNGVIVISTKQGNYNEPARISVNSNINLQDKPDLFYSQRYLPPATVMDIQKDLFNRGAYQELDGIGLPLYVELLIKQRDNGLTANDFAEQEALMRRSDLRSEALKYLYEQGVNQQYALNVRGGGNSYKYYLSAGYDHNQANINGNGDKRMNLSLQNTYRVRPKLELSGGIWYTTNHAQNNGISFGEINTYNPYARLMDGQSQALPLPRIGIRMAYQEQAQEQNLLDWLYRPVDEIRLTDKTTDAREIRLNAGVNYHFLNDFRLNGTYQYIISNSSGQDLYDEDSYFARNEVNRFTQQNGSKVIPDGGVLLLKSRGETATHSGRIQLNYQRSFAEKHAVTALGGAELRQAVGKTYPQFSFWGYNPELGTGYVPYNFTSEFHPTRPSGFGQVQLPYNPLSWNTGRNLSYFSNAAYTFDQKYSLSGSLRWDGSNLLGVKTNQRGTALWSAGASWELNKEPFYRLDVIPYLRLRFTYGSAGNIDKSQSHYPTISLGSNTITGLPTATLNHPGNPNLRWEQVNTVNAGLDWNSKNARLSGSIEWYDKHAKYLLSSLLIDPTIGVTDNYRENYANLRTGGLDIMLNTRNIQGVFSWESTILVNYTQNRVTRIYTAEQPTIDTYFGTPPYIVGKSRDLLYAIPWNGLNAETGHPLIYMKGSQEPTDDYRAYYEDLKLADLRVAGVTIAPVFGSLRNQLSWHGFQAGAVISFKTGHVFRRSSMLSGAEFSNITSRPQMHMDYFKRWEKPGDEQFTHIPVKTETTVEQRNWVYQYSDVLISPGDVIRLQDINLSYVLPGKMAKKMAVQHIRVYAYARNLGIIWRANKEGIDPDFPNADYPAPKTYALGIQVDF